MRCQHAFLQWKINQSINKWNDTDGAGVQPALMLYSPLQTLKSLHELEKLRVQQAARRVLLSTSRIVALRSTQGWTWREKKKIKQKPERQRVAKTRARQKNETPINANTVSQGCLDWINSAAAKDLKRGKHAGWWVREPPEFSWMCEFSLEGLCLWVNSVK